MAGAFMFAYPHWTWAHAALVGAILSATDPVSVVGILKEVGASKKTSAIIEGESLVNDAMAILLFDVLRDYHHHGELARPEEIAVMSGVKHRGRIGDCDSFALGTRQFGEVHLFRTVGGATRRAPPLGGATRHALRGRHDAPLTSQF